MKLLLFILSLTFFNTIKANDTTWTGNYDKNNLKHGAWLAKIKGKLIKKELYKHGVLKGWLVFNAKGETIETKDKKGRIRKYNPCGC